MLRLKSIVVCFLLFFVYIISCEGIGSKCDVNTDCAGLTNTVCMNGVCACKRNYTEVNGQCVKDLDASCNINNPIECTLPLTNCTQNQCVCQEGYVASSVNCCIPFKRLGDNCTSDNECINGVKYSWCGNAIISCTPDNCVYSHTCTCQGGYYPQFGQCFRQKALGKPCSRDAECFALYGGVVCKGHRCACRSGYIQRKNICVNGIGSKCDVNTDCAGLTNTVSMNGVCACKRNYTEVNGQCVKGINASCTSISECTLPFTNCTQNQCVCQEGYVASSVNCCIPYRTVGEDCEFDEDCSNAVPHSVCGPDRFCICANGYDFNKRGCFKHKSLGMACKHDGECYVTYGKATCQNGYCTCEFGLQYGRNVCMKRGYKFTNQQLITNSGTNNVTVIETFINTLK